MKHSQAPNRWLETKSSAPPGMVQLLSSVQPTRDMSEAEYARSLARVSGLLNPGPAGGGGSPGAGGGGAKASLKLGPAGAAKAKVAAVLLGLAALGGGAIGLGSGGESTNTTRMVRPRMISLQTFAPSRETAPAPESHPGTVVNVDALPDASDDLSDRRLKAAVRSNTSAAKKEQAESWDTLGDEIRLIGAAERLVERDPKTALSYLEQHAQRYPEGKLRNDRKLLMARVLVRLNRRTEAQDNASAIPPESLLGAKARKSLETP